MPESTNPFRYYLDVLSKWETSPAFSNFWYVEFDLDNLGVYKSGLIQKLNESQEFSKSFENWNVDDLSIKAITKDSLQKSTNQINGCFFARKVELPQESISIKKEGLNYGSFLSPSVSDARTQLSTLGITFLETNISFCTLIMRPWMILTSHYGLIVRADQTKNVKCKSLTINELAKTGFKGLEVRQQWTFYNVVPTTSDGYNLEQTDGFINRKVNFAFDDYSIKVPRSPLGRGLSVTSEGMEIIKRGQPLSNVLPSQNVA